LVLRLIKSPSRKLFISSVKEVCLFSLRNPTQFYQVGAASVHSPPSITIG